MWALLQSLGPPQMLSLVETRDDTHPKTVLINTPPLLWPMVYLYVYSEPVSKKTALMGDQIIVDVNQLIAITCKLAQH